MKPSVPNLVETTNVKFVSEQARMRKFIRYWGTEMVDGIEVFTPRRYYYPHNHIDERMEKLARYLGILGDVKKKQEGVRNAWLFLNPKKAKDNTTGWDSSNLLTNLQRGFASPLDVTIVIGPKPLRDSGGGWTAQQAPIRTSLNDQAGVIAEIKNEYNAIWNSGYLISTSEADPYKALAALYALRASGVTYDISKVEHAYEKITRTVRVNGRFYTTQAKKLTLFRVKLRIDAYNVTSSSAVYQQLLADLNSSSKNLMHSEVRRIADVVDAEYDYLPVSKALSPYWYEKDGVAYLRVTAATNTLVPRIERLRYILGCVDSDYKKKSRKWYETILAVVLVIVAVVLAAPSGGSSLWALGPVLGAVAVTAATITLAAMYLAIASYVFYQLDSANMAMAVGEFLKRVEPLVKIASVISIISSLALLVQQGVKQATANAVAEGVEVTLKDIVIETLKIGGDSLLGLPLNSDLNMEHVNKMANLTFDIYKYREQRDLEKETRRYEVLLGETEAAKEQSKVTDVAREYAKASSQLLAKDESVYADRYDRPYEWWSTPYHTGCMQANTVNALWLSKD